MTSQGLKKLHTPDTPGVYVWRDARKRPLYIGRATSLRDRLKSYFAADLIETRGPRIVDMVTKSKTVTWQVTDSVLEAIILESKLIKRYQPHYNVDERDDKSDQYVVVTDEEWPRVFTARARDYDAMRKTGALPYKPKKIFGPFVHSGLLKDALKILRKMFPFRDLKAADPRHEAFYRSLGRSPGTNSREARQKYLKTIEYLMMFFDGRKKDIRKRLQTDMNDAVTDMRFEDAAVYKRLLYAIDHINDIALIKKEAGSWVNRPADRVGGKPGFRIEAYDIAHLSGTNVVGAMTVSVDGQADKSGYRKFKISRQANDDIAGLADILSRRLDHPEWPYPDLIVVDGNEMHLNAAEAVLKARRISIPIAAVTKDEHHKASKIIGQADTTRRFKDAIVAINAEAHRFAIAYHRSIRTKSLLQ
ncbi:MAG: GIY-YIG nuclease family protein [Patescibacteria group bacterium]|nr:GIY-YIG nuclease family protein [Patescibacteria group bacterium]